MWILGHPASMHRCPSVDVPGNAGLVAGQWRIVAVQRAQSSIAALPTGVGEGRLIASLRVGSARRSGSILVRRRVEFHAGMFPCGPTCRRLRGRREWRGAILVRDRERAAQVVRFWRTIEMFSPQSVPKLTPAWERQDTTQVVLDVARNEPPPWRAPHPLAGRRPREGKTWQFTVYGGLYDVAAARAALITAFGEDSVPADARGSDGETALFAFTLDAEGCLVENSATLAACAWAISRLKSPGPRDRKWLDGFERHEREFVAGLNKLVPPKRAHGPAKPAGNGAAKSALATAGKVVSEQAKSAAKDAVTAGAKATGAAVTTAVGAGGGAIVGPVVGGIAGAVAGTFAEKLLTPRTSSEAADVGPNPTVPRLRMTTSALHAFVTELASALGLTDVLDARGVRVF